MHHRIRPVVSIAVAAPVVTAVVVVLASTRGPLLSSAPLATAAPAVLAVAHADEDCATQTFPSVTADPANRRWDDPYLAVSCDGDQVVVESNGIPPYEFQRTTPNDLREQRYVWRFPREPELAEERTSIPLLGPIAVAVNGLPIYGPNEGEFPDPYGDPVHNDILDWCLGHTARRGDYHYHAPDNFPYILGCYGGYVDPSVLRPGRAGAPDRHRGRRGRPRDPA